VEHALVELGFAGDGLDREAREALAGQASDRGVDDLTTSSGSDDSWRQWHLASAGFDWSTD
jgi:hypothetical protein